MPNVTSGIARVDAGESTLSAGWRQKLRSTGLPLRSIGWAGAGSTILQASTLGTSILAARILGVAEFGRYSVVLSTGAMFLGVAAGGLGIAATRYTARFIGVEPRRVGSILALAGSVATAAAVLAGGVLIAFSDYIAGSIYHLPTIAPALRISALYLFFTTLNGYQVGASVGLGVFREMALVNATQCLVSLALVASLAAAAGVPGATLGLGLAAFSSWFHYKVMLTRQLRQKGVTLDYRKCITEIRIFWSFAMPSAVSGVIATIGIWIANTILVRSVDVREIALFNAAVAFRQCVLFTPAIAQKVLSVSLAEKFGRVPVGVYRKLFHQTIFYNAAAALSVATVLFILRGPLLKAYGRGFMDLHYVVPLVLLYGTVEVIATSAYQAIPAAGAMWFQVSVMVFWAALLAITAFVLVPRYGTLGMGLSYCITWTFAALAYWVISLWLVRYAGARAGQTRD